MLSDTITTARERILKAFPERQFIHRTGGQVNYFILSTRAQLIIASIMSFVALWCTLTLGAALWGKNPLRTSTQELRVQKEEFSRYVVDMDAQVIDARDLLTEQQKQFELAAANFEQKHNTIIAMITQGGITTEDQHTSPSIYAQSDILMSPIVIDATQRQSIASIGQLSSMQTDTVLDASLVEIEADQNEMLANGETTMLARIEKKRAILAATGVSIEAILKNGINGMGGPLITLGENAVPAKPGEFLPRTDSIRARAAEVEALDKALASVPLAHPIDAEHYLTSPFGARRDPFTKRQTMHTGMDMASYRLAPIVATANGKISYVGRRSGYGRVVEIDHGYGFKTRYAHLAKSYVRRGQKVEKGEKIAGMGSSGRSTGTHLHYEVMFEKRSQNPADFLKAGQYVQ